MKKNRHQEDYQDADDEDRRGWGEGGLKARPDGIPVHRGILRPPVKRLATRYGSCPPSLEGEARIYQPIVLCMLWDDFKLARCRRLCD